MRKIIARTLVVFLSILLGITAFSSYPPAVSADANPDLIVQIISLSPENPAIDDTVTITVTIKNQGTVAAGISNVVCYVDTTILDTKSIDPLNAGVMRTATFTWKATEGSHTVKAVADASGFITETDENNNTKTFSLTTLAADLVVQSITWSPSSPSKGDSIVFSINIKNQGSSKSQYTKVNFFIDGNSRGFQDIAAINPNSTATATYNWTAITGQHTLKAVIDEPNNVKESNETNNELTVTFSTLPPDLTIRRITWLPENPSKGDTVTFTANVTNQGSGRSDPCHLAYNIDGVYQTSISIGAMNAGVSANITFTWTAMAEAHEIKVIIDYYQNVTESDETNNEKTASLQTMAPDLFVKDITWLPVDAGVGDSVTFTVTIKNQGSGRAESSRAVCYIDGEVASYLDIAAINSGAEATATLVWVAEGGSHAVSVQADYDNKLVEGNKDNNKLNKTITIIPPDLIIASIVPSPENPTIGDTVTLTVTIKNQGSGTAENFKVAYYIDDTLLSLEHIYSLGSDASTEITTTWKMQDGRHIFKAYANYNKSIAESDENNNESSITITPNMPDLTITNITWSPPDIPAGSDVTFNINIENQGSLNAGPSRIVYYVDGANVGYKDIGQLDASTTTTERFLWTALEGQHTIKIVLDSNNQIAEYDEDNNAKVVNLPPPDLLVQDITYSPPDAKIGDSVIITAIIRNQGSSQTPNSQVACIIDGLPFASRDLSVINAGGIATGTFEWVAAAGIHSIKIKVDIDNLVIESDETNNVKEMKFATLTPDLLIKNIGWLIQDPMTNDDVYFTITIKNQGTGTAGISQLKYTIDNNPAVFADITPVPAGDIFEYKFSSILEGGPHTANVTIDAGNKVTELDESNNNKVLSFTTIAPDLVVRTITCTPTVANAGDNVTITIKVENRGREKAVNPRLALSIDGSFLGQVEIPKIDTGSIVTADFPWKAMFGSHEISAFIDASQTIPESNETNNTKSRTITIEKPGTSPSNTVKLPATSSTNKGFLSSWWWAFLIVAALLGGIAFASALKNIRKK
jgi:subtilase family serine protease